MTKTEADIIIKACNKHGIYARIRNVADVYLVIFIDKLEIKLFEAAKYITNGLVLDKITKTTEKINIQKNTENIDTTFLKKRHNQHKNRNKNGSMEGKSWFDNA